MAPLTFQASIPTGYVPVVARWSGQALAVHPPLNNGAAVVTRGEWAISAHSCGLSAGTFYGSLAAAVTLAKAWDLAFAEAIATAPVAPAPYDRDRMVPTLNEWPQRQAWLAQLRGERPPTGPVDSSDPLYAASQPESTRTDANLGPVPKTGTRTRVTAADGDGGEQYPATVTIWKTKEGRFKCASYVNGRKRPVVDGKTQRMNGDVAAFKGADPLNPTLRLWFAGRWHDVPSIAQIMEWTIDSVVESPDGSRVEPDAPDSWLRLLGLV